MQLVVAECNLNPALTGSTFVMPDFIGDPVFNKTRCGLAACINTLPIMRGWGQPDFWLPRTELTLMTHNCSHISFGGCFMSLVRRWPRGSGEAPPASLKVLWNGCTDYLGLLLCFSGAVIRTIRTAFSLEAFKEQLQKQIVVVVAAVLAAEKQNQEKAHKETKASPRRLTSSRERQMHFSSRCPRQSASSRKIAVSFPHNYNRYSLIIS